MQQETGNHNRSTTIWLGIAAGTAIGVGIALARRSKPRGRWEAARQATRKIASKSSDVADAARDLIDRVRSVYCEGRKIAEDAGELWSQGRKMVGY